MKPLLFVVTALTSSSALFTVSQLSGYADPQHLPPPPLLAALPTTPEYVWVPLAADSELSTISQELNLSLIELSDLKYNLRRARLRNQVSVCVYLRVCVSVPSHCEWAWMKAAVHMQTLHQAHSHMAIGHR